MAHLLMYESVAQGGHGIYTDQHTEAHGGRVQRTPALQLVALAVSRGWGADQL